MSAQLDSVDRRILDCLQRDASLSTAQIARKVGLSQSPCWRRIRRLEQNGIIRERVTILDRERLGFEVTVFASIKLSQHGTQTLPEFEAALEEIDEVMGAWTTTGETDFVLQIVTRDIASYERLLRARLLQLPAVREVHSQIALGEVKVTTRLPLHLLAADD